MNGNGRAAGPEREHAGELRDKAPPQAPELEKSVLGVLMLDNSRFDEIDELLKPEDFYHDKHQQLAFVIWHLAHQSSGFDPAMVADELGRRNLLKGLGGLDFLREMCDSAIVANCVYHAQQIKAAATAREAANIGAATQRNVYERLLTPKQILERAIADLSALCGDDQADADDGIRDFPDQPGPAAYHGIMGEIVKEIAPFTEASHAAILFQLLVGFGNMVGRGPHWVHEADKHRLNMYLCLVGNTADGKKGTSWGYPRRVLAQVDESWSNRVIPGINSGPALIEQVADEETSRTGQLFRGVPDKRVLMYESEFTRLLAIFARDSETLGMVLRQAWEDENLAALSKKNPVRATGAHVSVVAHVTPEDLQAHLSLTDIANGLGNRFLWVCTRASKKLETEHQFDWRRLESHIAELKLSLEFGVRDIGLDSVPMGRTPVAQDFWLSQLAGLRKRRPGLLGAILARGPAQVMRLATTYAVFDRTKCVNIDHLKAALELWAYCVRSIDFVFGDRLGDKDADRLLTALEIVGEAGLSQSDIQRRVFSNHKDASDLNVLLRRMIRSGLIRRAPKSASGRGRLAWMWYLESPPSSLRIMRTNSQKPRRLPTDITTYDMDHLEWVVRIN